MCVHTYPPKVGGRGVEMGVMPDTASGGADGLQGGHTALSCWGSSWCFLCECPLCHVSSMTLLPKLTCGIALYDTQHLNAVYILL